MPFDQSFPEADERALAEAAPGERAHLRVTADLDFDQRFARVHVAVASRHVCVIKDGRALLALPLAHVKSAATDELFGSGRLTATTADGERVLAYFSRNLVPEFAACARAINELIAGREPVLPDEMDSPFCKRCHAPLPDRGASCPLCVPRGLIMLRLLGLVRPYRGRAIAMMAVTLAGVGVAMVPPLVLKSITDSVIGKGDTSRLPLLAALMMGSFMVSAALRQTGNALSLWLSNKVIGELQTRLHAHVARLRMSYLGKREPGELIGRVMHDTSQLHHFLKEGLPYLLVNAISFVAIGGILLALNTKLALMVFLPVPVLIVGGGWLWKRIIPLFHKRGSGGNRLYALLGESIRGVRVVKALAQERRREDEFGRAIDHYYATGMVADRTYYGFFEILAFVMSIGSVLVWYYGASGIVASGGTSPSLGDLMAFASYMAMFYGPLTWFAAIVNWMSSAFAGAERVFSLLDQKPEDEGAAPAADAAEDLVRGDIEFRGVRFSYERGKEVLKDVSFTVKSGTMLGLVGRSGAGKSTVISLLTRFYDPDLGDILVDGRPLRELPLERYRRQVGIVMQDPFLFHGSILENIRYGRPDASFAEVVDAAKAAHCHDFILEREDGYDTLIGDGGAELSGGERQRLSIARAILSDPRILILDEATSAVDSETEKAIQEAIARLVKGRTTIAIAHRLATLRNADQLIVIDDGRVVEQGTHDELIAKPDGHFAHLVRLQSEINKLRSEQIVEA